jgi:hypothetical protein
VEDMWLKQPDPCHVTGTLTSLSSLRQAWIHSLCMLVLTQIAKKDLPSRIALDARS